MKQIPHSYPILISLFTQCAISVPEPPFSIAYSQ